jgi:hypothetical protein
MFSDVNDFRVYVADKLGLSGEGFSIWLEVFGTLAFTLVFFFIFGGNSIIAFIFSWVVWEFMIFSFAPENYKIQRRLVIVIASVLLFIALEQTSKYLKRKNVSSPRLSSPLPKIEKVQKTQYSPFSRYKGYYEYAY